MSLLRPSAGEGDDARHASARVRLPAAAGLTKLVLRGDLRSKTGYGKATRALAALLDERLEIHGVDRHHNPADDDQQFAYPIMSDDDVEDLVQAFPGQVAVLNYTPPEYFRFFDGAVNVGSFFWETRILPLRRGWPELILAMDAMWAPTSFVREAMVQAGYPHPVPIVAWPHDFAPAAAPVAASRDMVDGLAVSTIGSGKGALRTLASLRSQVSALFLAVQSAAPRKGLPVLLAAWREHVERSPEGDDVLLLKLRFIHSTRGAADEAEELAALIRRAGFGDLDPRIALLSAELDDDQMAALYARADAYVTATFGEGFGGPLVEALIAGMPVIAPRHTGAVDLLAADYPFAVASDERAVGLIGALDIYPSASQWHVPRHRDLVAALRRFSQTSPAERSAIARDAARHAAAFCSLAAVRAQLEGALAGLGVAA